MKQTNNAIKFLMAQYRAIFKNAYFKGLAAAAVVTMGLAAGQAQAANPTDLTGFAGTDKITMESGSTNVAISGSGSLGWNAPVEVISVSGTTNHSITIDTNALTLSGTGSLTVKTGEAAKGLELTASGDKAISVDIGSVDVQSGLLHLKNGGSTSGDATLSANTITIGDGKNATTNAVIKLGDSTKGSGSATLGSGSDNIVLQKGGKIEFAGSGSDTSLAILAGNLQATGGELDFTSGSGKITAYGSASDVTISVETEKTALVELTDSPDTPADEGTLNIKSGLIKLAGHGTAGSGSVLQVEKGSVVLGDSVILTATDNTSGAGTLLVGSGASAELTLSKTTLDNFLKGTSTLDSGSQLKLASGSLSIGKSGSVVVNGDANLSAFTFSGDAAAGVVAVASGAKFGADNLTVDAPVANATGLTAIAKNNLTLGTNSANTVKAGIALESKNLTLVSNANNFVLQDKVTLKSMTKTTQEDETVNVAAEGKINGNAINVSGGSLTVAAGKYTFGEDITLTSGALTVSANENADSQGTNKVASSLKLTNGNITVERATGNNIIVSGANATLDISEAGTLTANTPKSNSGDVAIIANAGTLVLRGDQAQSFIGKSDKASSIAIKSGGKVQVTDNLELAFGTLKSGDTAQVSDAAALVFDSGSSGTLEVAGTLTINNFNTDALAIGQSGSIQAGTLSLVQSGGSTATELKLGAGNFTVLNSLQAEKTIQTSAAEANLALGAIIDVDGTDYSQALTESGDVTAALDISSGAATVAAGNWTAQKTLSVGTNGTLTIGTEGKFDAKNEAITASLSVTDLFKAEKGVSVNSTGTLTTNNIEAASGSITLSGGAMTINGKFSDAGTPDVTTDDKLGVKLASGSIVLNKDSNLTIQGDAMTGFVVDQDGKVTFATSLEIDDGAIDSNAGSNIDLVFGQAGSISKDGLDAISNKLFGNTVSPEGTVTLKGDITIAGLTPDENNEISWKDTAKDYADYLPTYIDPKLQEAKLTGVTSEAITGHFGSVVTQDITTAGADVTFKKNGGLYNATTIEGDTTGNKYFALGKDNVVLGIKVDSGSNFTLANGGIADHLTLASGSNATIDSKAGETKFLKDLKGENNSSVELKSGLTTVEGKVSTGFLDSKAGSKLVVAKDLTLTGNAQGQVNQIEGDVSVTGKTTLSGDTTFAGNNTFTDAFKASQAVEFGKGVTQFAGNADFGDELDIVDGAQVTVDGILKLTANTADIVVGEYSQTNEANSSGFLAAKYANLNGGRLVLDPAYGLKSSVAEIGAFTEKSTPLADDISLINGDVLVGQNSALLVGSDLASARSYLASLQDQNGSLSDAEGKIGSVLYINAQQSVKNGKQIIVDSTANLDTAFDKNGDLVAKYTDNKAFNGVAASQKADLYLGGNAVLALGDGANKADGAIKFASTDAAVYAEKGAKIVLDGSSFLNGSREVVVFTDTGATNGVKILGDETNSIRVETVNGLMQFYLKAGEEASKGTLTLDTTKVDSAFTAASAPMRDFLLGYTTLTKNWEEMYPRDGAQVAPGVTEEVLLGVAGPAQSNFEIDQATGKITGFSATAGESLKKEDFNNYVAVATGKDAQGQPTYDIYKKAYNDFLEKVVRNTNGAAADQAARMGDFGGAAESALVATSTTYDAVAGRFGMGQQAGTMTIANNGQGSGLWVTPVYKSHESDGFDADGLGYGSDITLYGVALGGDVTLANGVRVGAMFNVGSGDADGQGAASVVSNDFDYFGGSIYAGYAIDNFSIVGDISYTTIDSDVEANTAAGKTSTSFDTTALSVGVTGQYSLKVAEMDVTPHAGMRFTRIDMDDYSIDSAEFGEVGQYNASSANVFSIPVGVTISKEYVTDTWTVKPSFDLTLTGNFGDDTVDGTVSWTGVSNYDVSTKAEFVDNFTYGAAVGFAAKTGNFGLGLGLNYTGSSNTDEFGVNANARYMF